MSLPRYDNRERRYRHTDTFSKKGLAAVTRLLDLPESPSPEGLLYDLSFFSGGIGVLDQLAITLPADLQTWNVVLDRWMAKTPEEASLDSDWTEDFFWLVGMDNATLEPRIAAVRFLNSERRDFQLECHTEGRVFFQDRSDVNDWAALWGTESRLNYLGFSQG